MKTRTTCLGFAALFFSVLAAGNGEIIPLGAQRELFVDDYLIARRTGLELQLHHPIPQSVVLTYDAPWEGTGSDFETVFRDGGIVRLYYSAADLTNADGTRMNKSRAIYIGYAESKNGIDWVKPDLGLFAFDGSKRNNIVWAEPKLDNFTPFKDTNPACPPDERYKALSERIPKTGAHQLIALKSRDGIHWSYLGDKPVLTGGAYDTQNTAFWDPRRRQYWTYVRDYHHRIRDIRVATSPDFHTWTEATRIEFADSPDEALYTNQIQPYYRAPQIFLGFPTRYTERTFSPAALQALPSPEHRQQRMKYSRRYGTAVTDGQFMSSRDGRTFHRWDETFIPPGPERKDNWIYGDGYQSLGLLETPAADPTAPPELSFYVGEGHWMGPARLRRYTIRIDGFVSLHARRQSGEFLSKPLAFAGRRLTLNFGTSAAGSIRVELQDPAGHPFSGFALSDCDELFGDTLDRTVTWAGKSDVGALAGKPIRLRMVLAEADLYSLKFQESSAAAPP